MPLTTHNHNSTYAALNHSHAISAITDLQTTLNGKANSSHTHSISDVSTFLTTNQSSEFTEIT